MGRIEVLAPAGNFEALKAAAFSGADAVYMGGSAFSARAGAVNFTRDELKEAVEFAHIRDVKCYIAFNTLIKDNEIKEAVDYAAFLAELGVDGIIVQDMGLFSILRECCKSIPLHCSTQMTLLSPGGVRLLKELGASRAVLARELTLSEIREIHLAVDIQLEVFVHGALCMSVSGQCYFSAMLGSRSGNRGRCAGTCRLPFYGSGEYSLSLKDLSFIEEIKKLEEAGVCSAKIEGRLKRAEYVAAASHSAFLAARGEIIPEDLSRSLGKVFSRSGFTRGYLEGKIDREMFGARTREDAASKEVFSVLHSLYKNELQKIPLWASLRVKVGQKPVLELWDKDGRRASSTGGAFVEKALNKPITKEDLALRISRLGGTPYFIKGISCDLDEAAALPASAVNSLRREVVQQLNELRKKTEPHEFKAADFIKVPHTPQGFELRASFESLEQVPGDVSLYSIIFLPYTTEIEALGRFKRVGISLPRAIFSNEEEIRQRIKSFIKMGYNEFLCENLSAVSIVRELGGRIHGGFSLNISNTKSLESFENLSLISAELSFELTIREAAALGGKIERGIMVYGRQELMLVRNCPIKGYDCGCGGKGEIFDRRGISFPIRCQKLRVGASNFDERWNFARIFNSLPLTLADRQHELKGLDFGMLRFTVETPGEIMNITKDFLYRTNSLKGYTRGLFYRGVV